MLVARFATLAALVPLLAGCSARPGEFSYEAVNDEFTGIQSTRAVAQAPDKDGSNSKLELSLRCERQSGVRQDAYRDTLLTFRILDDKGEGQLAASVSLKMNGSQPFMSEGLEQLSHQTDAGDTELHYVYAAAMGLPQDQWPMALSAVSTGGGGLGSIVGGLLGGLTGANDQPSPERVLRLVNQSGAEPTSILVRYESLAGQLGTAEFDLTDANFRRVLTDCGWEALAASNNSVVNGEGVAAPNSGDQTHDSGTALSSAGQLAAFADEMPRFVGERAGNCHFAVGGKAIIEGSCFVTGIGNGGFFIAKGLVNQGKMREKARLFSTGDSGVGIWERPSETGTSLGNLRRQGSCWTNERVELCASVSGEVIDADMDIWNLHYAMDAQSPERSDMTAVADKLRACGFDPRIDVASNYVGNLRPGIRMVLTGPFNATNDSEADLERAVSCLGSFGSQSVRATQKRSA